MSSSVSRARVLLTVVSLLVSSSLLGLVAVSPPANAQLDATSPCPDYEYGGTWRIRVAGMGCNEIPPVPLNWAIDAVAGRVAYRFGDEVEGFACVISVGITAGCRNRDGRGFTVEATTATPRTTAARATTPTTVPTSGQATIPRASSAFAKICGVVEGGTWTAGGEGTGNTWAVRAQAERCPLASARAAAVTLYIVDPYVGRTFDVGEDRCVRTNIFFEATCSLREAGTPPWELYNGTTQALKPIPANLRVGTIGLYSVAYAPQSTPRGPRTPVRLAIPASSEWSPPLFGTPQPNTACDTHPRYRAPFAGAPWDYVVGSVLDSGTTWRVVGNSNGDLCETANRLAPVATARLAGSVPVYESKIEGWNCFTYRRTDFTGPHMITCMQDATMTQLRPSLDWFTLYQDSQFNDHLSRTIDQAGPFLTIGFAMADRSLPTDVRSCQPYTSDARRWRLQNSRGSVLTGNSVLLQARHVPCGVVDVVGPWLSAEALRLNRDPRRFKMPGITCRPVPDRPIHVACDLTNTRLFGGVTPKIGAGVVNEYVFASISR